MKPVVVLSVSVLIASVIVAWSFRTAERSVQVSPRVEIPSKTFFGDYEPHTVYKHMKLITRAGTFEFEAGAGEYKEYDGFYPMPTSTGQIKVNMVKSGQPMNDNRIDHIFVTEAVEFRK
jgi:hypothetical protein